MRQRSGLAFLGSDTDEAVALMQQLPAVSRYVDGLVAARASFQQKLAAVVADNQPDLVSQIQGAIFAINRAEVEARVYISLSKEMIAHAIDEGDISADDIPSYLLDGLGEPITITLAICIAIIALATAGGIALLISTWASVRPHLQYASDMAAGSAAALRRWEQRAAAGENVSDVPPIEVPDSSLDNSSSIDKAISGVLVVAGVLGALLILPKLLEAKRNG